MITTCFILKCHFESVNGPFCTFEIVKVQLLRDFPAFSSFFGISCFALEGFSYYDYIVILFSIIVKYLRSLPTKTHLFAVFVALKSRL